MEIAKLFASVGIRFNEGDIKRVDSHIQKLQSQLKALSTNIRVKVDPIVQTAGKGIDQVGKSVTSQMDPKLSEKLARDEKKLIKAISHMERAIKDGKVSQNKLNAVMAKLSTAIYQLNATLKAQGKVVAAKKVELKAKDMESKGRVKPQVVEPKPEDKATERKLTRAISHMEKSMREGRVSKESHPKVLEKLAATLYQLESTLRKQGKAAQADKIRTKAERTSERATKHGIKQEQAQAKAAEKAAIAESKAAEKARVAQAKAEALRRKPMEDQSRDAKRRFGQKQGSARNVLQEIGLSSQVATGKLNTALVNIQAMNRDAKKFDDTAFKLEGFRNALSSVNKETARQVKGITQSGRSQEDQLKQLQAISSKVEENLKRAFSTAQRAGLSRVGARATQDILQGKQTGVQSLRAASMSPMKLEDQIATLETRSGSRGGFKSIKEQGDLIEAIETRKRQALLQTAGLAQKLTSSDLATRRSAAQTINQINRDITRISAIENRARARQVMDTNRQIENSFRMMAKRAFTSMNNIRIIATTATGAMASFAGITPFIQDNRTLEQLNSAFIAITGNAKDAKMMMDFVNKSSDTLGLSFKDVAEASKSFSAATQAQGVSLAETQEMLTGVFQASRVLGLSSEDTQGAIRAMSQMFGKVNVSAEELRQQLGERIPNAIPLAAKAMYGTTEATDKLFAAMQRGELKAKDLLPKLTKEFANFAEAGLPSATKSIGAEIERFKNSMFGLFTGIGKAGALAGVTQVIRVMADVIQGLTPILSKLIGTFSYFARVLLTPLEMLAKALKLITKIDNAIGFLIGRVGELTGASKGVTEFAQSLLSLSTLVSLAIVAPIFTRFGTALKTVLMWLPSVKFMSNSLKNFKTAAIAGSRSAGVLAGAFAFLGKTIKSASLMALSVVRKYAIPFLAVAALVEEFTSVTNANKDSLLKWALNSKSAIAGFVRPALGLISALMFAIDQLFGLFFGKDLIADNFREQVEDIFKIDIDPSATVGEIWDRFWHEMKMGAGASGGITGFLQFIGISIGSTITNIVRMLIAIFTDFETFAKAMWEGAIIDPIYALIDKVGELGSKMFEKMRSSFIDPLVEAWNKVAERLKLPKINIDSEEDGSSETDPIEQIKRRRSFAEKSFNIAKNISPHTFFLSKLLGGKSEKDKLAEKVQPKKPNIATTDKPNVNVTVNQTLTATPGMSAEEFAKHSNQQAGEVLQNELVKTMANSPRTE